MTTLHRVLWALIFVGILTGVGKLGWDHYQEGLVQVKAEQALVTLNSDNLADQFKSGLPMLIMICDPDLCEKVKPVLAKLQIQYNGKAKIVMLDALATPDLWSQLLQVCNQVLGPFPPAFPTAIMLDKDTKPTGFKVGFGSVDDLTQMIDKALAPAGLPAAN